MDGDQSKTKSTENDTKKDEQTKTESGLKSHMGIPEAYFVVSVGCGAAFLNKQWSLYHI